MQIMNENINLVELLKDCPKGTKLYSPILGIVEFQDIQGGTLHPIIVYTGGRYYFTKEGKFVDSKYGECMLFPSKDQRDWSKWKCPKPKFDPKTLQPFDKVLARIDDDDYQCWFADFVSMPATVCYDRIPCIMSNKDWTMVIPYNDDTKHLVGTTDEAPEYYRYWED